MTISVHKKKSFISTMQATLNEQKEFDRLILFKNGVTW